MKKTYETHQKKDIDHFIQEFIEICKVNSINYNFKLKTKDQYEDIADLINAYHRRSGKKKTRANRFIQYYVKYYATNNTRNGYQKDKLNSITRFLSLGKQDVEEYLRYANRKNYSLSGVYLIYWNSDEKIGSYCNSQRKIIIEDGNTTIISPEYVYKGWKPKKNR